MTFPVPLAGVVLFATLGLPGLPAAGASVPIDYTQPVLNLAHDPDAQEPAHPRNLLTTRYPPAWLAAHLARGTTWVPYPTIADRARWTAVPEAIRQEAIAAADQNKDKSWEPLTATMALDYWRNGNRADYTARSGERQSRLQKLLLGELVQAQGRFLDPIADAVWLISEETFWGAPVHIPQMQRSGGGLPNVEEPTIELFAAERGAALSWTLYLLGDRLDTVSPWVRKRIRYEIDRRIFTPFLARNDFWWMGLAERKDLNNWTPWIVSNVLTCALLAEDDPSRRTAIVAKCLQILDRFLNRYPDDGGCDEGPSYWQAAGGSTFDSLELLQAATGSALNVYDDPVIRHMAHFICDAHVAGDWALNYGDGNARARPLASLVYQFGQRVHDPEVAAYGAWLARRERPYEVFASSLNRQLPAIFGHAELLAATPHEPLARDVWLPVLQMAAARDSADSTRGLYFGIRGYYNAKSHNHNDAGSFMLYADGQPMLIDVGVEVYTTKTFSPERYDIWTMQSAYHNLPTVNGQMQGWGHQYAVTDVTYRADDAQATVRMDLAHAYPPEAAVTHWIRELRLVRGQNITLTESYQLTAVKAPLVLNFMTACDVDRSVRGRLVFTSGAATASGAPPASVTLTFDPERLSARVEDIATTDARLRSSWGGSIRRIQLVEEKPALAGSLVLEFKKSP